MSTSANAVAHPGAVVVHTHHAAPADGAMVRPRGLDLLTLLTEAEAHASLNPHHKLLIHVLLHKAYLLVSEPLVMALCYLCLFIFLIYFGCASESLFLRGSVSLRLLHSHTIEALDHVAVDQPIPLVVLQIEGPHKVSITLGCFLVYPLLLLSS